MRLGKSGALCSLPGLYSMSVLKLAIKAHQRARRPSHVSSDVFEFNVVRLRWSVSATAPECPMWCRQTFSARTRAYSSFVAHTIPRLSLVQRC